MDGFVVKRPAWKSRLFWTILPFSYEYLFRWCTTIGEIIPRNSSGKCTQSFEYSPSFSMSFRCFWIIVLGIALETRNSKNNWDVSHRKQRTHKPSSTATPTKARDESIPPLINQYMSLSATMKTFGTCVNADFGDVEESGILITIADVYPEKSERHLTV